MFHLKVSKNRQRALWWALAWHRARENLSCVLVLSLLAAAVAGGVLHMQYTREDLQGAQPKEAEGVITSIGYGTVDKSNSDPNRLTVIAIDGNPLMISPSYWRSAGRHVRFHPGAVVRYTYRAGKSGRWYLDALELLPEQD